MKKRTCLMILFLGISAVYSGGFYSVSGERSEEKKARRIVRRAQMKSRAKIAYKFLKPVIGAIGTVVVGPEFAILLEVALGVADVGLERAVHKKEDRKSKKEQEKLQLSEDQIRNSIESRVDATTAQIEALQKQIDAMLSEKSKDIVFKSTEEISNFVDSTIETAIDNAIKEQAV